MINSIRKWIKKLIYSNDLLFNAYYTYVYKPANNLDLFLNRYSKDKKDGLHFIQIGANDGQWNDPLYKFIRRDHWKGMLIEPQKDVFEKLVWNYRNFPKLFFENVAMDNQTGSKNLYCISFTKARWASGLSSFKREDVQRMIDAGYIERMALKDNILLPPKKEGWITTEEVKTLRFPDLISKYNLREIDLVVLDIEGYEFDIIKTIPFENILIKVIIYEHTHFNDFDRENIKEFLNQKGYKIVEAESDTIALNNTLNIKSF